MDLKPENLLIFLLAILPGAVAQRAKASLVPRSLQPQTVVSEIGDYVLTSAWIHVPLLLLFRIILPLVVSKEYFGLLAHSIRLKGLDAAFFLDHWKLVSAYFLAMVLGAYFFGIFRGYQIRTKRFQTHLFRRLGLHVVLDDRTLWNVLIDGDLAEDHDNWVEVELKDDKGFYSGRLKTYTIVADSERNKEFFLEPASFKLKRDDKYQDLAKGSGVLLTFSEVVTIRLHRLQRQDKKLSVAAGAGSKK